MLAFIRNLVGVKTDQAVNNAVEAIVRWDPKSATEAELRHQDACHLGWHRNWIVVKTRDVEARRLEVQERQDVRDVTAREARDARVALRVLERLRDRARLAFDTNQARLDMLAIDELATLRAARRLGDIL